MSKQILMSYITIYKIN